MAAHRRAEAATQGTEPLRGTIAFINFPAIAQLLLISWATEVRSKLKPHPMVHVDQAGGDIIEAQLPGRQLDPIEFGRNESDGNDHSLERVPMVRIPFNEINSDKPLRDGLAD
jgi:hypothetical protein